MHLVTRNLIKESGRTLTMTYLLLLRLRGFGGEKLLQSCMPVTICRGGCTRCARCAGIASGGVRRMRPGRGAARTDAFVNFAASMMILRVPPQASCVAVRLAASLGLALVRLFISMCQHVSVPETRKVCSLVPKDRSYFLRL